MHQSIGKKNKIIVYLLFLLILSTTNGKLLENQNSDNSKINHINIEGLSSADNKKISNELNDLFYKNILLVRREEIQRVINKYNIIEKYSVKKNYPSTINIKIKPTKFVARLSNNEQFVGANGKLIFNKESKEILPYVFGEFNSEDFLDLKKNIEKSKFNFKKFKTLYFFPSSRWDILTSNDILIKLPRDNLFESIHLAYKIINSDLFNNKKFSDLRVSNHLIIK
jgi:cell division protein FtsQ